MSKPPEIMTDVAGLQSSREDGWRRYRPLVGQHGIVLLVPCLQLREGQRLRARTSLGTPLPRPIIAIGSISVWP
jgi:hypothetical protein